MTTSVTLFGKITAVNSDGTYAIQYDDGDKSNSVAAGRIFSISNANGQGFSVGQKIQAYYGTGSKKYNCEIANV